MAKRIQKMIVALATAALSFSPCASILAQGEKNSFSASEPVAGTVDPAQSGWLFLPYAQFKIPFNVEPGGVAPAQVQLFVSTDQGASWQPHSKLASDKRFFEFRAASEGAYLFGVQTKDTAGNAFVSSQPPMRVIVDTTKPQMTIQADLDSAGRLVAIFEINDLYLDLQTVRLQYRIDTESNWTEGIVADLNRSGDVYRGHAVITPTRCREIWLRLVSADWAQNKGEVLFNYKMPRTAAVPTGLMVSQRDGLSGSKGQLGPSVQQSAPSAGATPGAMLWNNTPVPSLTLNSDAGSATPSGTANAAINSGLGDKATYSTQGQTAGKPARQDLGAWIDSQQRTPVGPNTTSAQRQASGSMVSIGNSSVNAQQSVGNRSPSDQAFPGKSSKQGMGNVEELPLPRSTNSGETVFGNSVTIGNQRPRGDEASPKNEIEEKPSIDSAKVGHAPTPLNQAYHSRSRAFSLDYSVDSLKGSQVAEIELWGTEDGGRTWVEWGKDPDHESPFDIQVADDGLFGFRMVVVGNNGLVSNRPRDGDDADMWINVDSISPVVKITRAVYGEGHQVGMLVIDYKCDDSNLHDQPISLAYSDHQDGPWTTIAGSLRNTGVYLWKAGANLPSKVYLRVEAVDRGGNIGSHRLDIPIAVEGLAPRGRIQGFRPLDPK